MAGVGGSSLPNTDKAGQGVPNPCSGSNPADAPPPLPRRARGALRLASRTRKWRPPAAESLRRAGSSGGVRDPAAACGIWQQRAGSGSGMRCRCNQIRSNPLEESTLERIWGWDLASEVGSGLGGGIWPRIPHPSPPATGTMYLPQMIGIRSPALFRSRRFWPRQGRSGSPLSSAM